MSRTILNGPTTFNFDSSNASTIWAQVRDNYDLNGQQVTFQAARTPNVSTVYTNQFAAAGALVGQLSPYHVTVLGSPGNPGECIMAPTQGNCFSAADGAAYCLSGFIGTLGSTYNQPGHQAGEGIIVAGRDGKIMLGRPGYPNDIIFIFSDHPPLSDGIACNDITVNNRGYMEVNPGRLILSPQPNSVKQCFVDVGANGLLVYMTNGGEVGKPTVRHEAYNSPRYIAGIFRNDGMSYTLLGGVWRGGGEPFTGIVHGKQWVCGSGKIELYPPDYDPALMWGDEPGVPAAGTLGGAIVAKGNEV